jgi:hypothetical protein
MDQVHELDQRLDDFARDNPDVMEALRVFDIAAAEYRRALSALNPSVTYAGASTQATE